MRYGTRNLFGNSRCEHAQRLVAGTCSSKSIVIRIYICNMVDENTHSKGLRRKPQPYGSILSSQHYSHICCNIVVHGSMHFQRLLNKSMNDDY